MSGYQRVKLWNLNRAWRRSPLTLLQSWRADYTSPLLFKLNGDHYILCRHQEVMESLSSQALRELPLPLSNANLLSLGETQDQYLSASLELPTWISHLQRFQSVMITPLLERSEQVTMPFEELFEAPFTWTIAYLFFGLDLRKGNTERAASLITLLSELKEYLKYTDHRLETRKRARPWLQRRLRKLYRQIGSFNNKLSHLREEEALDALYMALQWRDQMIDSLAWFFVYLEQMPKINNQIFIELNERLSARAYEQDALSTLPSLHQMILETFRVAPPHWVTCWGEASVIMDEEIFCQRFFTLPPHTRLISSPLFDHYHQVEWPSPQQFLPHRFMAVIHGASSPSSFTPFGVGLSGQQRFTRSLHTIAAIASTILRRGGVRVMTKSGEPLSFTIEPQLKLSASHEVGASLGRPELNVQFKADERYIHIPSARV